MARSLIDIDEALLERARTILGPRTTKKEAVNTALSKLVHPHDQRAVVDRIAEYDTAFDHIADIYPAAVTKWIMPRGSID